MYLIDFLQDYLFPPKEYYHLILKHTKIYIKLSIISNTHNIKMILMNLLAPTVNLMVLICDSVQITNLEIFSLL